jgi:hypothetical protein
MIYWWLAIIHSKKKTFYDLQFYITLFWRSESARSCQVNLTARCNLPDKILTYCNLCVSPASWGHLCPFCHAHRHGARKATNALRAATCQATNHSRLERSLAAAHTLHGRCCYTQEPGSCRWTSLRARGGSGHHLHARRAPDHRPVACRSANAASGGRSMSGGRKKSGFRKE